MSESPAPGGDRPDRAPKPEESKGSQGSQELSKAQAPPVGSAAAGSSRAGAPVRIAAIVLSFILAFVVAVAVVAMLDVAKLTPCEDVTSVADLVDRECFDGTAAAKTRTLILGWIGSGLGLLAIVAALNLGLSGRGRRTFAGLTAVTLLFFALSLVL